MNNGDCLLVGDIHITDDARRPTSRMPGYTEQILDKLRFCVEKANEVDVPIVQAGDTFHLKAGSKNSHELVQSVHEVLKHTENGVWFVPGNHDQSYDRLDSLSRQPLGALCRMDNMHLLVGEDPNLPGIAGVPYISEFDSGGWQHTLKDIYEDFGIVAETPTLLVTHAPMFPPGSEPGVYANINLNVWADYWAGIAFTYFGHIHETAGTFMSPNGCMQFCNQGALSRNSLHESSLTRQPGITLWRSNTFTRIEVPCKPPEEVFLLDEADRKALSKASAEEFSAVIGQVKLPRLTLESIRASLAAQASDPQVLEIIEQALESVR